MKEDYSQSDFSLRIRRFSSHMRDFPYVWILIALLIASAIIAFFFPQHWKLAETIGSGVLLLMTALLLVKPMNAVYGLIGASGSIRLFFGNFILITIIFAGIYQLGFFHDAGITYDVNQPHIDFKMFADSHKKDSTKIIETRDTIILEHQLDSITVNESLIHVSSDELRYQRIAFMDVWRNTILTTLTQEPTELFSIASTNNAAMNNNNDLLEKEKSQLFHWILIFHIIISWIFFGVFISLLYNKFRYES